MESVLTGMDLLGRSKEEKSDSSGVEGREIMDVVGSASDVLFRCDGATDDDRELMVTESGLIGIRWGSKGGLYDIHDKSLEFQRHGDLYRISMGSYGIRLSEEDFKRTLKMYNRIRGE